MTSGRSAPIPSWCGATGRSRRTAFAPDADFPKLARRRTLTIDRDDRVDKDGEPLREQPGYRSRMRSAQGAAVCGQAGGAGRLAIRAHPMRCRAPLPRRGHSSI
jgi:hypothetical protein